MLNEIHAEDEAQTICQKERMRKLILDYHDVFSTGPGDLGRTTKIRHQINTGNSHPIRQGPRWLSPLQMSVIKDHLTDMLDQGLIKPSVSPWASPIVLVKKKDGSTRFCVDYRKVNGITVKDGYPIPRIDDTLDTLG